MPVPLLGAYKRSVAELQIIDTEDGGYLPIHMLTAPHSTCYSSWKDYVKGETERRVTEQLYQQEFYMIIHFSGSAAYLNKAAEK